LARKGAIFEIFKPSIFTSSGRSTERCQLASQPTEIAQLTVHPNGHGVLWDAHFSAGNGYENLRS